MSRNILKKRPPASPNKPPHAPAKMTPKGQPVPLSVNFFVKGNTIQRTENVRPSSEKHDSRVGNGQAAKVRPHSAQVDLHVLKSMSRSPSVDSSFYDRFERLDRDTIIGDTAFKEKGGRIKSASHVRTIPKRSNSAKPRKRSKSAVSLTRKQSHDVSSSTKKSSQSNGSFFETAMSFDDETKQNTLTNAVRQISPRTLGIDAKCAHISRRRPRSGRKTRERSVSSKRSEGSVSQSSQSAGTASLCSSVAARSDRHTKKQRSRKSRSRTRRPTPRASDNKNSSKKNSPERSNGSVRPVSASNKRKQTETSDLVRNRLIIKNLKSLPTPTCFGPETEYKGDFAYHYTPTGNRGVRKSSASRRSNGYNTGIAAINAVKKANDSRDTCHGMSEIDRLFFRDDRRPISSKLPKLKMMVAPTAMPLASLVRSTSAKMLMSNPYEHRRAFDV